MSDISQLTLPNGDSYNLKDSIARGNMNHIAYGQIDSTSTSTNFTATVEGITELKDGTCVMLRNGVVTSAADFTININGLGALPVYNNMATGNAITPTAPTRDTTIFNINYTMLFTYVESDIIEGGCWICYRGYNSNDNSIGYQLRTNSATHLAADKGYRYRIWLTSADGTKWVPINTSTSTNSTTSRTLNTRKIDPFGPIVYRSTNSTQNASEALGATAIWQQYNLIIGYSYVLSLTENLPVYLKCTSQSDGSAVMSVLTQTLPSTNDGYIYIFLGIAYDATHMELRAEHPIYWHDGTALRLWTGKTDPSIPIAATAAPIMDGTAAVGTSEKYAKEDHVHPTDTSRQATLVSGTNIKTINNNSLLGSGNLTINGDVNQNAFSNVKVGSTTVAADTTTDTFELAAGSNITLTPDATNDKITIAATDTTYESKTAASGGTAISLVTTGEKYTWNNKSDTDTLNTAGSTNSTSKLFLIGATSQAANPQTYSQDTTYVDMDGHLYSNSKQVVNLSDTQALTNKTYNGYTLAAASAKSVDTTISSITSTNLPTSAAVVNYVDTTVDEAIVIGSTQPTSNNTKIWIKI